MKDMRMINTAEDLFAEVTIHADLFQEEQPSVSLDGDTVKVSFLDANGDSTVMAYTTTATKAERIYTDMEFILLLRSTVEVKDANRHSL